MTYESSFNYQKFEVLHLFGLRTSKRGTIDIVLILLIILRYDLRYERKNLRTSTGNILSDIELYYIILRMEIG